MRYKDLELYPFQEQAIRAIQANRSVIVSAPTGAGKTIIAEYAIDRALREGRRVVYTSPIKALSNQKYRDFMEDYEGKVGIMTGDVTVNPSAPVLIMTTEIFRNTIFEDRSRLEGIDFVIFDEVHYLGDIDRGSVWEESIIFAPQDIRFVALSATIGNLDELKAWMSEVRHAEVELIHTDERPVPLENWLFLEEDGVFSPQHLKENLRRVQRGRRRRATPGSQRSKLLKWMIEEQKLPALYFCFSRRRCEQLAQKWQRRAKLLNGEERGRVVTLFDELIERYDAGRHPAVRDMRESVSRGVLYHHAGMMPVFKDIVERLFCSGLVKLLFTTETFALGVNMPARSVVFDALSKYNGVEVVPITPLDFRQMAGRAGRQGIDTKGEVFSLLDPEFDSPKRIAEILHKKPGAIKSRFSLGYSTILNLKTLMGDDIGEAVEKSFAAFQTGNAKMPLLDLKKKLRVLNDRGYLDDQGTTGKGRFCSRINGFEVHLAEFFWDGILEDLDPIPLAVLCEAIIYSPRGRETGHAFMRSPLPQATLNRSKKLIRDFRKAETRNGIIELTKPLDFGLSGAIESWMLGASFGQVSRRTGMQDGDFVRSIRLAIQVLRQLAWALPREHHVSDHAHQAIQLLNRDEVDAEKQLKVR